jgi:hypothetical protein
MLKFAWNEDVFGKLVAVESAVLQNRDCERRQAVR